MIQLGLSMNKETEHYIEHEVRLRLHHELFLQIDKRFDKLESKFNWTMGLIVTSIIIPIILHRFNMI